MADDGLMHPMRHRNGRMRTVRYVDDDRHTQEAYKRNKGRLIDCNPYADLEEFPDESSLFIGDLSRTVNEDMLLKLFQAVGPVEGVDIKRDKVTKNNLGYGFVKFRDRQQAERAKHKMNGMEIGGRAIRIGWAQKNTNLFVCLVGDVDQQITGDHLKEIFSDFGPIYKEDTFVKRNKYGFVKFKHRAHAEKAKAALDGKHLCLNNGYRTQKPVRIGWGDANTQRNCVHVQFEQTNASNVDLKEEDFKMQFEKYGIVVKVSLPRYSDKKLKGYGFIHFEENDEGEESAARAITELTASQIKGVVIMCNFGKRQNQRHKRFAQKKDGMDGFHDGMYEDGGMNPMSMGNMNSMNGMNQQHAPFDGGMNSMGNMNGMNQMGLNNMSMNNMGMNSMNNFGGAGNNAGFDGAMNGMNQMSGMNPMNGMNMQGFQDDMRGMNSMNNMNNGAGFNGMNPMNNGGGGGGMNNGGFNNMNMFQDGAMNNMNSMNNGGGPGPGPGPQGGPHQPHMMNNGMHMNNMGGPPPPSLSGPNPFFAGPPNNGNGGQGNPMMNGPQGQGGGNPMMNNGGGPGITVGMNMGSVPPSPPPPNMPMPMPPKEGDAGADKDRQSKQQLPFGNLGPFPAPGNAPQLNMTGSTGGTAPGTPNRIGGAGNMMPTFLPLGSMNNPMFGGLSGLHPQLSPQMGPNTGDLGSSTSPQLNASPPNLFVPPYGGSGAPQLPSFNGFAPNGIPSPNLANLPGMNLPNFNPNRPTSPSPPVSPLLNNMNPFIPSPQLMQQANPNMPPMNLNNPMLSNGGPPGGGAGGPPQMNLAQKFNNLNLGGASVHKPLVMQNAGPVGGQGGGNQAPN